METQIKEREVEIEIDGPNELRYSELDFDTRGRMNDENLTKRIKNVTKIISRGLELKRGVLLGLKSSIFRST